MSEYVSKYIIDNFKLYFPSMAKHAVEYRRSGNNEITIVMDDGDIWLFDNLDHIIHRLPDDANNMTEEECRREFSRRLRRKMFLKDISLNELADRTGIKAPQLSRYVTGRVTPNFYTVDKIAKALSCSVDELRYLD